jgi:hypothetical protein
MVGIACQDPDLIPQKLASGVQVARAGGMRLLGQMMLSQPSDDWHKLGGKVPSVLCRAVNMLIISRGQVFLVLCTKRNVAVSWG